MNSFEITLKNGRRIALDMSIFEIDEAKGMVNLTKIAKACGKDLSDWTRLESTRAYIEACKSRGADLRVGDFMTIPNGNDVGSWASRRVAIKFAQWISPDFEVWCTDVLDELFQKGKVELKPLSFEEMTLQVISGMQARIEEQKKIIEHQAPKVEFYDDVTGSEDTIDMASVAKVLNMGIGRNKLFEFLRDKGILRYNNEPMQRYIDAGWFRQVESKYYIDGNTKINIKTVVFQKGVDGIRKILRKEMDNE